MIDCSKTKDYFSEKRRMIKNINIYVNLIVMTALWAGQRMAKVFRVKLLKSPTLKKQSK